MSLAQLAGSSLDPSGHDALSPRPSQPSTHVHATLRGCCSLGLPPHRPLAASFPFRLA